uniref:Scavenger receptor class F member 2-like n=1 Tax=Callorhinchus milii TaxID=7868 RepID=A0A4W3GBN8_CALMI
MKVIFLSVAHHDIENTLNCSYIEPPSMVDQPSPSWSSHGSFSSFDTADDGPVYCVPHEESMVENLAPPISEEEAGEYTSLKGDATEMLLLKSSDSEASSNGSGSTSGAVYAHVARLSKQSKDSDVSIHSNSAKTPSPDKAKPPPPDPATKPKLSWIHGKSSSGQSNASTATHPLSLDKGANQTDSREWGGGVGGATGNARKRNLSDSSGGGGLDRTERNRSQMSKCVTKKKVLAEQESRVPATQVMEIKHTNPRSRWKISMGRHTMLLKKLATYQEKRRAMEERAGEAPH